MFLGASYKVINYSVNVRDSMEASYQSDDDASDSMHVVVLAPLGRICLASAVVGEIELLLKLLVGGLLDRVSAD